MINVSPIKKAGKIKIAQFLTEWCASKFIRGSARQFIWREIRERNFLYLNFRHENPLAERKHKIKCELILSQMITGWQIKTISRGNNNQTIYEGALQSFVVDQFSYVSTPERPGTRENDCRLQVAAVIEVTE